VARHDALRLRLHSPGVALLNCDDRFDVGERDTSDLTPDEFGAFVTADAQVLHRAFVLNRGPLIRCVHYPHPVMARVLLLAHHFIVDQIGWILLETELDAELHHAAVRLPAVSYHDAVRWLAVRARSDELATDVEQWERLVGDGESPEAGAEGSENSVGLTRLTCGEVPAVCAHFIFDRARARRGITFNAVAVVAVMNALFPDRNRATATVNLIGSGRRGLTGMPDLSRTIGDFTCLYPVTVTLATSSGVDEQLRVAQQHLDRVPSAGISFGLLKYLGEPTAAERLRRLRIGDITVNYVGRRRELRRAVLAEAPDTPGDDLPLGGERDNLHEVDFVSSAGALEIRWYSSSGLYTDSQIEGYIDRAVRVLSGAE
jgi:non-ribosomal peptide synthase protein (TIGR01720 family)